MAIRVKRVVLAVISGATRVALGEGMIASAGMRREKSMGRS